MMKKQYLDIRTLCPHCAAMYHESGYVTELVDAMQNKGRCMICNRMNGKDYIVYEKPKNKR